jgi:nucleoid-associated protein YgaU
MASKDLKIAYLLPINGRQKNQPIEVLFNPAEYSLEKGNTFQSTPLPGLATPVTQWVTGNADVLTMDLFFDTYAKSSRHSNVQQREDVRNYTRKISSLMDVDPTLHSPPIVQFIWGPPIGSPENLQFTGTIEKVSQKFTYFLDDGTPVRATLNITIKEYKTVKDQLAEIGRESPDHTKMRVFKDGESLWFYAAEEYLDPGEWRVIADQNKLDNPRLIESGTELELPPLKEASR